MSGILIVEDDLSIRWSLRQVLQKSYEVWEAESAEAAVELFRQREIDLCLIDIDLPGRDGYALCSSIRGDSSIPIIFLTVKDDEDSIVRGLDCGADDYIVKPFSGRELESRIRAQLRNRGYQPADPSRVNAGGYILDRDGLSLARDGHVLRLTKQEASILLALMGRRGSVVTRAQMLHRIGDMHNNYLEDNSLSVYISRLRKKLKQGFGECPIETMSGIGYRWNAM